MGGIEGCEVGVLNGYDVKATDNFADIIVDKFPCEYEEFAFNKLAERVKFSKDSICYLVLLNSGNNFCDLLTGQENALSELYEAISIVIED